MTKYYIIYTIQNHYFGLLFLLQIHTYTHTLLHLYAMYLYDMHTSGNCLLKQHVMCGTLQALNLSTQSVLHKPMSLSIHYFLERGTYL